MLENNADSWQNSDLIQTELANIAHNALIKDYWHFGYWNLKSLPCLDYQVLRTQTLKHDIQEGLHKGLRSTIPDCDLFLIDLKCKYPLDILFPFYAFGR